MPYVIIGAVAAISMLWFIFTQRTLSMLDENINDAMSQIGVQLSVRWDALSALLNLVKGYGEQEYNAIWQTVRVRRPITVESDVQDAAEQENLLFGVMSYIMAVAERYPTLKADRQYAGIMDNVNQYEGMARQSRLIYNDSVTKFNRAIRLFPTCLVSGLLGFSKRGYLEVSSAKADLPDVREAEL